jgi:hypothetical protein
VAPAASSSLSAKPSLRMPQVVSYGLRQTRKYTEVRITTKEEVGDMWYRANDRAGERWRRSSIKCVASRLLRTGVGATSRGGSGVEAGYRHEVSSTIVASVRG